MSIKALLVLSFLLLWISLAGCMRVTIDNDYDLQDMTIGGSITFSNPNDMDTAKDAAVTDPEGDTQTGDGADNITPDLSRLVPNLNPSGIGDVFGSDGGNGLDLGDVDIDGVIPPEFQ